MGQLAGGFHSAVEACASHKQRHRDVQPTGSWIPAPYLRTTYQSRAVRGTPPDNIRAFLTLTKGRGQIIIYVTRYIKETAFQMLCVCSLLQPADHRSVNENLAYDSK